jgi:hypothetical protein
MKVKSLRPALWLAALGSGAAASADSLNLQTGSILEANASSLRVQGQFFSEKDVEGVVLVEYRTGFAGQAEFFVRGASAEPVTFQGNGFSIRTGGTELEFGLRAGVPAISGLTFSAGVSFLSTPATDTPGFTYAVAYRLPVSQVNAALGFKGFYNSEANTAAYGLSLGRMFGPVYLSGDYFLPYNGRNTRSITTGASDTEAVYSFMASLQLMPNAMVYGFVTNSMSSTTAFSLSASLDNTPAIGAGIKVKF